ncbi:MAG: transglycosylase domain-containing protein [Candidatus Pacearchaeota archaeon]|jgi:membrane peptidoglycan carboxypeptidase
MVKLKKRKIKKSGLVRKGVKSLFYGGVGAVALLSFVNFLPTRFSHCVEKEVARIVYNNIKSIERIPEELKPYGSSVVYLDSEGGIIGGYGRKKKGKISEDAKKALLACEDYYFFPHEKNSLFENLLVHEGVSLYNIAGTIFDRMNGKNRGGSTISMQVVKKMIREEDEDRTYGKKLEEMILAYLYEEKFGKEKLLEHYMSNVPLGNRVSGFQAAAEAYFAKPLDKLNFQQLVTLGSIIPNHNRLRALYKINNGKLLSELSSGLEHAFVDSKNKINSALRRLHKIKEISDGEFQNWLIEDEEDAKGIGLKGPDVGFYGNDAWAAREITSEILSQNYFVNGNLVSGRELLLDTPGESLVIETEIDRFLVNSIKKNIKEFLESDYYDRILRLRNSRVNKSFGKPSWEEDLLYYKRNKIKPPYENFEEFIGYLKENVNIGVMAVNRGGNIIAKVGGKEFFVGSKSQEPDFTMKNKKIIDILKSPVAVGSTIKPITAYSAMALSDKGVIEEINLNTLFADIPIERIYNKKLRCWEWMPGNWYDYDLLGTGKNRYLGREYSLLEAQVLSVNTIFARLYSNFLVRKEVLKIFDTAGLEYNHENARWWPYGIGSFDVDPATWLGIYSAFIDGNYRKPSIIKNIFLDGEEISNKYFDFEIQRILFSDEDARRAEIKALHEVCNRGSGRRMENYFEEFKDRVTGKTGTETVQKTSLFVSHYNSHLDREAHPDETIAMITIVTTNTGGYKRVGYSTEGPVRVAGMIYNDLYQVRQILE